MSDKNTSPSVLPSEDKLSWLRKNFRNVSVVELPDRTIRATVPDLFLFEPFKPQIGVYFNRRTLGPDEVIKLEQPIGMAETEEKSLINLYDVIIDAEANDRLARFLPKEGQSIPKANAICDLVHNGESMEDDVLNFIPLQKGLSTGTLVELDIADHAFHLRAFCLH